MTAASVIPLDQHHDDTVGRSSVAHWDLSQVLEESESSFSFPDLGSSQVTSEAVVHEQTEETVKVRSTLAGLETNTHGWTVWREDDRKTR